MSHDLILHDTRGHTIPLYHYPLYGDDRTIAAQRTIYTKYITHVRHLLLDDAHAQAQQHPRNPYLQAEYTRHHNTYTDHVRCIDQAIEDGYIFGVT